ncbi:hypothetical protein [Streptomyces sp. NPDC127119]|uniref:hypothetical protein n=1 Tax=Streptomyces sp. NPDC127119 TaxID=3345370 RepID=UPI003625ABDD
MIEDWYFCAAMRDTWQATHSYLSVLDLLDTPDGPGDLLPNALEALNRCEPWTALHVAPRLLRLARTGGGTTGLVLGHLLGTVRDTLGHHEAASSLETLLHVCAEDSPSRTATALRAALTAWNRYTTSRTTDHPFRDLTGHPVETLLLAATAHLAERPETVETVAAELRRDGSLLAELTNLATKPVYGRLPCLLALRMQGATATGEAEREQLLRSLARPEVGWVHLEPDLMGAAARLLHPGGNQEPEELVADLDLDAVTLNGLRRLRGLRGDTGGIPVQRVLDRLGMTAGKPVPRALSTVLWQQSLWDLAALLHPRQTASVLVGRWGPTSGRPHYPVRFSGPVADRERATWSGQMTDLWQLRTGASATPLKENGAPARLVQTAYAERLTLPGLSNWAFSPWVDRDTGPSLFPAANDPVVLLRLLSSLRTSVRLMRHGGSTADPLSDLVMHGTELLSSGIVGGHLYSVTHDGETVDESPVPTALVPLAQSAQRTCVYAMRGVYAELHPRVFAERAIAGGNPDALKDTTQRFYRQARLLHESGGALQVLVRVIRDVLTGAADVRESTPQSRWFEGDPPLVERLLRLAAGRLGPREHRKELGNALLLLRILLHQDVTDGRLTEGRNMDYPPVTFQEVLLVGPDRLDLPGGVERFNRWVKSAPRDFQAAVKLPARTVQLLHALAQPREPEREETLRKAVDLWIYRMDLVGSTAELARVTRWYMLGLIDVVHDDGELESRVLDKLLDVFTEFGLRTPTDLRLLFDRLSGDGFAARLRRRLLSLSYDGRHAAEDHSEFDVWAHAMYEANAHALREELDRLVWNLTRSDDWEAQTNREFIANSWQRSVLTSSLRSLAVPLGGSAQHMPDQAELPDPRTVVSVLAHRSEDRAVYHYLPVDLNISGGFDLFRRPDQRADVLRRAARDKQPELVGVVCGFTEDRDRLLVNCGLGQPLEAEPYPGAEPGDLVAVTLGHRRLPVDPAPGREPLFVEVEGRPRRLPPLLRPGDVQRVRVELTSEGAVVHATAYDTAGSPAGTGPLSEWDPDLSRWHRSWSGDGWPRPVESPFETVARYDDDGWHPVDGGFTEFLAAGLPYARGSVALLTLMAPTDSTEDAWRFCLAPGRTFLLPERIWTADTARRLRTETHGAQHPAGLRCWVRVTEDDFGRPRLALTDPPEDVPAAEHPEAAAGDGIDRRNLEWQDLCAGDTVCAIRRDGHWQVDHDIPGFPPVIVEDMPPLTVNSVEQGITGWEEKEVRRARVQAVHNPYGVGTTDATAEEYDRLHGLRKDDVVRLRTCSGSARRGTLQAWTRGGNTEISVDAESVMLSPAKDTVGWQQAVRGRDAVITGVRFGGGRRPLSADRPALEPLSDDALLAGVPESDRAAVGERLRGLDRLDGLLLVAPAPGAGRLPQVWLRLDGRVIDLPVPWDAFTLTTRRSGDQLVALRSPRGWSLTPRGRQIFARCLWELDNNAVGVTPVGYLTKQGSRTETVVGQGRPGKLVSSTRRWLPKEVGSGQVDLGEPFTAAGDSATRHRAQVLLSQNRSLWGVTDHPYFTSMQEAYQVDTVKLSASPVGNQGLWDVRRVFTLRPAQATETGGDLGEAWTVVTGTSGWNAELRGGEAVLAPVPLDRGARRIGLPHVPLAPGETARVEGVEYDKRRARVVVRSDLSAGPGETQYLASYREVPPMPLRVFMNHQNIVERRETETSLNFVEVEKRERKRPGAPPEQWLLFEWGFGLTLRVLLTDVRLDGRPLRGVKDLPFFHGDRVTRLTLTPRVGGGGGSDRERHWLDVPGDAIVRSRERRLYDQAVDGIVPGLTVRLDREAKTVTVLRVESLPGTFDARERAGASPTEVSTPRLRLTDGSVAAVLRRYPTGPDVVRVLGRLDTLRWDKTQGAEAHFQYLRPVLGPKGGQTVQRGQYVFMWGEKIKRRPNDVWLILSLGLGSDDRPQNLTARVTRRTFAHREDVLRRLFDEEGEDALRGTPYLVELRGPADGYDFDGRISAAPARPANALRGHLTSRNPSCFAVVTQRDHRLRLELRAGVHVALRHEDLAGEVTPEVGAVVRVALARDRRFLLRPALPGDAAYAMDGREVVVYPKNPLLKVQGPTSDQLAQPLFTLSGLPNVEVPPARAGDGADELGPVARLMRERHPKIGRLRRGPDGEVTVAAPGPGESAAGWLSFYDDTLQANLEPVLGSESGGGPALSLEPAQASFADRSAQWIARRHDEARRVPQDRLTGHWPDGTPESYEPMDLGTDGVVEPVVPAPGPTLRYPLDQARRYGYPAGYLTERRSTGPSGNGAARPTGDVGGGGRGGPSSWYTVAGPIRSDSGRASGLWVEMSPGCLVEIPGELAHATTRGTPHPLEAIHWDLFQPGDEVRLSAHRGGPSEPECAVLHDWRPGLRGMLGSVPALLTVLAADSKTGALVLGGGNASLEYPVSRDMAARYAVGDTVRLTPDNRLLPRPHVGPPDAGEAVLAGVSLGGGLFVHGLPGHAVVLAEEGWAGAEWIRAELAAGGDAAATLLSAVGGVLAMTCEGVDADGRLRVSRAAQPRLPSGDHNLWESPSRVTGTLRDGRLVVRAGGALLAVRPEEIVPGIPAHARVAVASALTGDPDPLWLRTSVGGELSSGLRATQEAERRVLPVAAVAATEESPEGSGLLCREEETGALRWLPASHSAWAELSRDQLHDTMVVPQLPVRVLLLDDGRVSVIGAPAVLSHFRNLSIGRAVNLVVLGGEAVPRPHGVYQYLARVESNDVVVSFTSDSLKHLEGERLIGEVESLTNKADRHVMTVGCVPRGKRGTIPDLPSVVVPPGGAYQLFRRYSEVCDDPAALVVADNVTQAADEEVVRAAWHHLFVRQGTGAGDTTPSALPSPAAAEALRRWMDIRMEDGWEAEEIHLQPLIGATVLMAALGEVDPDMASLAVQLALNVGERAQRAVHIAPMLADWLGRERSTGGLWGRLWALRVSGLLNPRELERLVTFCRGRLYGAAVEQEPELLKVVVGLLLSVGESVALEPLLDPAEPLVRLAGLGRALIPPGGDEVAQQRLHVGQIHYLSTVFQATVHQSLQTGMPGLVFLPYRTRPNGELGD